MGLMRLDYGSATLAGLPNTLLVRLQSVRVPPSMGGASGHNVKSTPWRGANQSNTFLHTAAWTIRYDQRRLL